MSDKMSVISPRQRPSRHADAKFDTMTPCTVMHLRFLGLDLSMDWVTKLSRHSFRDSVSSSTDKFCHKYSTDVLRVFCAPILLHRSFPMVSYFAGRSQN